MTLLLNVGIKSTVLSSEQVNTAREPTTPAALPHGNTNLLSHIIVRNAIDCWLDPYKTISIIMQVKDI